MTGQGVFSGIQITSMDPDPSRVGQGGEPLLLHTTRGDIRAAYHEGFAARAGIVWVWGANGGLEGPASGVYRRLAEHFAPAGISSIRVDYRDPRNLPESVRDAMAGVAFLREKGLANQALVGHSFGGAVVITAAPLCPEVKAVVALSSQTRGTEGVTQVAPRPLLLVHGEDDRRLPATVSRTIFLYARQPKELVLFPGAGHELRQCQEELDALLKRWLPEKLLGG